MTSPEYLAREVVRNAVRDCKKKIQEIVIEADIEENKLKKRIFAKFSPSIYGLAMMDLREENFFYNKDGVICYNVHKDQLTLF